MKGHTVGQLESSRRSTALAVRSVILGPTSLEELGSRAALLTLLTAVLLLLLAALVLTLALLLLATEELLGHNAKPAGHASTLVLILVLALLDLVVVVALLGCVSSVGLLTMYRPI
jgi:hypothetical protein